MVIDVHTVIMGSSTKSHGMLQCLLDLLELIFSSGLSNVVHFACHFCHCPKNSHIRLLLRVAVCIGIAPLLMFEKHVSTDAPAMYMNLATESTSISNILPECIPEIVPE